MHIYIHKKTRNMRDGLFIRYGDNPRNAMLGRFFLVLISMLLVQYYGTFCLSLARRFFRSNVRGNPAGWVLALLEISILRDCGTFLSRLV